MGSGTERILIIDDDELVSQAYAAILEDAGWGNSRIVTDSRMAMNVIRGAQFGVILLDLHMPHVSGTDLLASIAEERPETPVIILTLEDSIEVAVECMKLGAFDYMSKPIDETRLVTSVAHATRMRALHDEVMALSKRSDQIKLDHPEVFEKIVTQNDAMLQVFAYIEAIASSPRALLITGESGTGKELIARAVHDASGRKGPFVPVNVSGLDDTVFSDTLFGHRRGAFTGADSPRKGLIEKASQGTLFLDEIGDLDNGAQVKLLRLLQEDEYYPLGSDTAERSRARIVAATNADLKDKQSDGTFRKDLYFRLMAHHVELPPLRDRTEDLRLLIDRFASESAEALERERAKIPSGAESIFMGYSFPGNVRELQAIVYDVISRTPSGEITRADFLRHPALSDLAAEHQAQGRFSYSGPIPKLSEVEDYLFREAMEKADGNQSAAARMLGVSQSTLSRWTSRQ